MKDNNNSDNIRNFQQAAKIFSRNACKQNPPLIQGSREFHFEDEDDSEKETPLCGTLEFENCANMENLCMRIPWKLLSSKHLTATP